MAPPRPGGKTVVLSVAGFAACVAHEVALDVQDLGLAAHVDAHLLKHGHQVLRELLLLLPRLPHFAHTKVAARPEPDVREEPFGWPVPPALQPLAHAVVLLRLHATRLEPDH